MTENLTIFRDSSAALPLILRHLHRPTYVLPPKRGTLGGKPIPPHSAFRSFAGLSAFGGTYLGLTFKMGKAIPKLDFQFLYRTSDSTRCTPGATTYAHASPTGRLPPRRAERLYRIALHADRVSHRQSPSEEGREAVAQTEAGLAARSTAACRASAPRTRDADATQGRADCAARRRRGACACGQEQQTTLVLSRGRISRGRGPKGARGVRSSSSSRVRE